MRRFTLRAARKGAHVSTKVLHKALSITTRVENKAVKVLNGSDYSMKVNGVAPLEKIYYNSLPYITPLNPSLPAIGSKGSVVLLLPTLDNKSFYGGTATALVVAGMVALQSKKKLKVIQTIKTGKGGDLSAFFKREGLTISNEDISVISVADRRYNFYGYLSIHADDIHIASAWWDAHLLSQLPLPRKFIYLVQDFEPIFYNNSDLYVLAENTYKQDSFVPLCNTELMADFMKERSYCGALKQGAQWFEPAVSRVKSGIVKESQASKKRRLFLYGRPDVHRNLFFTALESIDYAFKAEFLEKDSWECFMAGQDNLPDIQLPSGGPKIINKGKMDMEEYIAFSKTIDLALSPMMAPHPNYPTLEFASTGSAVVTTRYANKQSLDHYSKNIIMCDITVESMAGAIKEAASMNYELRMRNMKSNSLNSDWKLSLNKPLRAVLKALDS